MCWGKVSGHLSQFFFYNLSAEVATFLPTDPQGVGNNYPLDSWQVAEASI